MSAFKAIRVEALLLRLELIMKVPPLKAFSYNVTHLKRRKQAYGGVSDLLRTAFPCITAQTVVFLSFIIPVVFHEDVNLSLAAEGLDLILKIL